MVLKENKVKIRFIFCSDNAEQNEENSGFSTEENVKSSIEVKNLLNKGKLGSAGGEKESA